MSGVPCKVPCKVPRDRCIVVISIRAVAVKHTFASEYCVSAHEGAEIETEIWEEEKEEAWEVLCNGEATLR